MESLMILRRTLLLASGFSLVGCSATATKGSSADPAAKRAEIDATVDAGLSNLYAKVPGTRELVGKAQGVLVIPKVVSAGFIIGGSYGQGAMRKQGVTTGYYSVSAGSVGLLAGAEEKSIYMLFMSLEALQKFENSKGWTAGADASVTLLSAGAAASVDTKTAQQPIIGYVISNAGLMANLSLDGTKFNKLEL
jgi:lipid-binding SYLF domain-containing protein